jgi:hypothetical protein
VNRSSEIEIGFKIILGYNIGLIFGVAANIPLYGNQFTKFSIEKTSSNTDDNLIPEQNKDLETKLKYDDDKLRQPPTYYLQAGITYQL